MKDQDKVLQHLLFLNRDNTLAAFKKTKACKNILTLTEKDLSNQSFDVKNTVICLLLMFCRKNVGKSTLNLRER